MKKFGLKMVVTAVTAFSLFGMGELAMPNNSSTIVAQAKSVKVSKAQFKSDMAATKKAVAACGDKSIQKDYRNHGFKIMYSKPSTAYDAPDFRGDYCISSLMDQIEKVSEYAYEEGGAVGVTDAQISNKIKATVNADAILYQQFRSRLASKWQVKVGNELSEIRRSGVYYDDNINSKTQPIIRKFLDDINEAISEYSVRISVVAGDDGVGTYNPKTGKDSIKRSKKSSTHKYINFISNLY